MLMRKLKIKAFKNLGIEKETCLELGSARNGNLLLLYGRNNEGKSNVLEAILKFGLKQDLKSAKTNFYDCKLLPELSLVYEYNQSQENDNKNKESLDLALKIFGIKFTEKSKEKFLESENVKELEKMLNEDELFILQDFDKSETEPREEIRLIAKNNKKVFLCGTDEEFHLKCFRILDKAFDKIDNINLARKLLCRFRIDLKPSKKDLNDSKILREELRKFSLEKQSKKEEFIKISLKDNTKQTSIESSQPYKRKIYTSDPLRREFNNLLSLSKKYQQYIDGYGYKGELESLVEEFESWDTELESFKEYYESLKDIIEAAIKDYNNRIQSSYSYRNNEKIDPPPVLKDFEKIKEKAFCYKSTEIEDGILFDPSITFYKEHSFENTDLTSSIDDLEDSLFFMAIDNILENNFFKQCSEAYEKDQEKDVSSFRDKTEEELNKLIKESISKRFNDFYPHRKERYEFKIRLEEESIFFNIYKDNDIAILEEQSSGFKWFFNFFFGFLYNVSFQIGDIILIDELETHLDVLAQRDLKSFLREFAFKHKITFIASTHSPFLIDIDYLDELRFVKPAQKNTKAAVIENDFSKLDNIDPLAYITECVGINPLFLSQNKKLRLIFTEGLTDYNYLSKFKLLWENENKKSLDIVFLPINGLGKENEAEKRYELLRQKLPKITGLIKQEHIIILVDNDKAGQEFKKKIETEDNFKIVLLNEAFEENYKIRDIESLFDKKDLERINPKSLEKSAAFKYSTSRLKAQQSGIFICF